MYQSQKRRRIKPFARPTSFDINVVYDIRHYQSVKYGNVIDPYFPAHGTDEAFHVLEGEVLMQTATPQVRRYGDHQMHVFSFANGLKADGAVLNAGYKPTKLVNGKEVEVEVPDKAGVLAGLKYAGVAVTEFSPEKDIFEQGFVMTVAGLNTIFNNGKSIIYPGDVICADIPFVAARGVKKNRALQTGVPREKLQFVVTPYRDLLAAVGDEALASRFIMGTALSYSRPGSSVDVVLHRCNSIVRRSGGAASVGAASGERSDGFSSAESSKKTKKTKSKDKK